MATRIIEFGGGPINRNMPIVPASQRVTSQAAITATGTSAQSSAVDAATSVVLVQSDEAVYVLLGTNPTATTNDYRIAAGGEQYFDVPPGKSWKVAVRT